MAAPLTVDDGEGSAAAGTAAHAVLTQRLLLSLVASFQRGPLGVVVPLLRRLRDDGFVRCAVRIHWIAWRRWQQQCRITTPLRAHIRPTAAWTESATPEAIAMYDSTELHALRTVVAATTFAAKPAQATRRLLHRVAEAAAAFGRIDMLRWLHERYDLFARPPLLTFCMKLAIRHGQRAVLEWIEATMSTSTLDHTLEGLRGYDLHEVVKRRHVETVRWLLDRNAGVVPAKSLRAAVEGGDVAMLRVLLSEPSRFAHTHAASVPQTTEQLVTFAVRQRQPAVVSYLVSERKIGFTATTVEKAIAMRQLAVAKCLLDHRELQMRVRDGPSQLLVSPSLVQQLVGDRDVPMLAMLASVKDADAIGCTVMTCCHFATPSLDTVRALLPCSSTADIAATLMRFAVRKQTAIVETILDGTNKSLPVAVVAFVDRVLSGSLGPLATRAMAFFEKRDSAAIDEILALVPTATPDDVRDTVLRFLSGPAFSLTSILKTDAAKRPSGSAACDEAFLQLCLSLRQNERDPHHRAVFQFLHTRKKPRASDASSLTEPPTP